MARILSPLAILVIAGGAFATEQAKRLHAVPLRVALQQQRHQTLEVEATEQPAAAPAAAVAAAPAVAPLVVAAPPAAAVIQPETVAAAKTVATNLKASWKKAKKGLSDKDQVLPTADHAKGVRPLEAWKNGQPGDAWLGAFAVERFAEPPTVTVVPEQKRGGALDPCPLITSWPSQMVIDAPDPCAQAASAGAWSGAGTTDGEEPAQLMNWASSCSAAGPGLVPVVSYTQPSGQLFGTSQPVPSIVGSTQELRDCMGTVKYTIDEKVYHMKGQADKKACQDFGSCDGTVYLQYIIRDWTGKIVAKTGHLRLFQSHFTLTDKQGKKIALIKRVGKWSPMDQATCFKGAPNSRRWLVTYADPKAADSSKTFSKFADRWPVAQLVTIMAHNDASRRSTGLVAPSTCEVEKSGLLIFVICFGVFLVLGAVAMFSQFGFSVSLMQAFFIGLEQKFCPRRMAKPGRFASPWSA